MINSDQDISVKYQVIIENPEHGKKYIKILDSMGFQFDHWFSSIGEVKSILVWSDKSYTLSHLAGLVTFDEFLINFAKDEQLDF